MDPFRAMILLSLLLAYHGESSVSADGVWTLVHDFIQHNIAGIPAIHEQTEWTFDPELGKQKSVRYEAENGRHGELAIAKIGMGIGYKGPWGTFVKDRTQR